MNLCFFSAFNILLSWTLSILITACLDVVLVDLFVLSRVLSFYLLESENMFYLQNGIFLVIISSITLSSPLSFSRVKILFLLILSQKYLYFLYC